MLLKPISNQYYWVLTVKQREFFVSFLMTLIVSKNSKLSWGCQIWDFKAFHFPEELETRFLHLLRIFLWFSILFPFPLLMPRLMVEYTLSFILKKHSTDTEMATKRHSEYVTNGKNLCFWVDLRLHIITNTHMPTTKMEIYIVKYYFIR